MLPVGGRMPPPLPPPLLAEAAEGGPAPPPELRPAAGVILARASGVLGRPPPALGERREFNEAGPEGEGRSYCHRWREKEGGDR